METAAPRRAVDSQAHTEHPLRSSSWRTAGANVIEGLMEITLGLLFAGSIAGLFAAFPQAIVGAMMFMVGLEMVKFAKHLKVGPELVPLAATVGVALLTNMAFGFVAGIAADRIVRFVSERRAGS